ncbi:hypothetical protein PsorP6_012458 [Peronosclerospora sorghi]|uniref:Uncharacterized protein n=1 Tax=Peronosclerospora sorghi TaxID=230839 RepID=A0ACC0WGW9_9STRA|nr:hypothetical protein PsorP6_012458 [Peronosclerospora sorghi]
MTDTQVKQEQRVETPRAAAATTTISDAMRCQYSSKRCDQERTHKKSGGLHKFCAMHREKANRNQMRLDHRRRVLKQQQKELQRQQWAHQMHQLQLPSHHSRRGVHSPSSTVLAAGQTFLDRHRPRLPGALWPPVRIKPVLPLDMNVTMHTSMPLYPRVDVQPLTQQQLTTPSPTLPLFDQLDLDILEAMLFSSDDEQPETMPHCTVSALMCSPSIVNV